MVENIPPTTPAQRRQALESAGYNPFNVNAEDIDIDLLSDSGTGATSADQESVAARSDETYAQSRIWKEFHAEVSDLTGYPYILPAHQGRGAERVVFPALLKPGQISVSNTHFDTTEANVLLAGCEIRNLPCVEAKDLDSQYPFKGNIDLVALESLLAGPDGSRVGLVLMTITNNGGGGQPVSMANLQATKNLCQRFGVPMFLDAARFAENAWLVTQREGMYENFTPRQVATRAFEIADGCLVSLKKDGLSPEGAFIGLKDGDLAARCEAT
ncbi:MAG: tryptophanase, partial [Actinocatenispora sp.]